ncbi:MAG: hypothetical protein M1388_00040 [Thaumarchaeota archaeon]|nr:hypothetical protein [Nitrososphaerota archaeon]
MNFKLNYSIFKRFLDSNADSLSYEVKGDIVTVTFNSHMSSALDRLGSSSSVKISGNVAGADIIFNSYRSVDEAGEHDLPLGMLEEWLNYIMMSS